MTAPRPRDLATLDAYVSRDLDDADAEQLEESMFDAIGREPLSVEALYLALRDQAGALAERGTFHPVLRAADASRLRDTSTLRVGTVEIGAPVDAESLFENDILLVKIPLALEGVTQLDVETSIGGESATYPDVPFDPGADCIWMCCEVDLARESVALGAVQRFVAVRGADRRVLREVRLDAL